MGSRHACSDRKIVVIRKLNDIVVAMHFIQLQGAILNVAEIESIVDKPGATSTLTFRGGRTIDVPDVTARQIAMVLQKNGMLVS
jgi:hypothetical protein